MRILVVGGTGLLGSALVPLLTERGHHVTVGGRRADGPGEVVTDLSSGRGIQTAVQEAETVVHLASDVRKQKETDIEGTRRLLSHLDGRHLVYMSIVGVDRHPFRYYRTKYETEQLITTSGQPHTIVRATQFHDFMALVLGATTKGPVALIPKKFVFQPISTDEVAEHLADIVEDLPTGLQPDIGGPEVHTAEHLARTLMEARGRERPILNLPLIGSTARAFRSGVHTNAKRSVGEMTWTDWLATH